jgi:hypothetical protein
MTARGRWLRENNANRVPRRVVTIDCESYETVSHGRCVRYAHTWRCGAASFDRLQGGMSIRHERMETHNRQEFLNWILSKVHRKETLWVFAHNLPFDLSICDLWAATKGGRLKINRWVINDPPTIIDATYDGCKIRFCDVMNWWPDSVQSLALAIGETRADRPGELADASEWTDYCRKDVSIIRKFMLRWIHTVKLYDLGNFKPTIASQAMGTYTHTFMGYPILAHGDEEFATVERAAYFGGRVYCGYVGNEPGPVFHYDVNSLYPHIMQHSLFPTEPIHRYDSCSPDDLYVCMERCAAVAEVMVRTDEYQYPKKLNGRVYYPIGRYRTALCGDELYRALQHGQVLSVGRCMLYRKQPIFQHWSEWWLCCMLEAKKRGDVLVAKLCKMLCNSLSGKWAQKAYRWEPYPQLRPEHDYHHWHYTNTGTGEYFECRSVAGCVQRRVEMDDDRGGLVAISGHITSGGRAYMDSLRDACGEGLVYYQDTDSLIVDGTALDRLDRKRLLSQTRIGALKKVGTLTNAQFDGPHRWQADGQGIHPGIRSDAEEISDGVYLQETCQGASEILSKEPKGTVSVTPKICVQRPIPMGCVVGPDGFTWPMRIDE